MNKHLVISLSDHGFGHIGQTAPIVRELKKKVPGIKVTIRSASPKMKLIERFGTGVEIIDAKLDIGMVQLDALNVDVEKSYQAYKDFHENWDFNVTQEANALSTLKADLVLSNISYLSLAGAKSANIPAIAYCSLNWFDIFQYYFGKRASAQPILAQMRSAYDNADRFIIPEPGMLMPGIKNKVLVGPVAQLGKDQCDNILSQYNLPNHSHIVLISLGGMKLHTSPTLWPHIDNIIYLVPDDWDTSGRNDMIKIGSLDYPFIDLMCSCDVLIAKPGYGSFVESACTGTAVLYLERVNWPEIKSLTDWLQSKVNCAMLDWSDLENDVFEQKLNTLLDPPRQTAQSPIGVEETTAHILEQLDKNTH